jgi:hypothetical protein
VVTATGAGEMLRYVWRVRTIMIAIAAVSIICAAEALRRRSNHFRNLAQAFEALEMDCLFRVSVAERGVGFSEGKMSDERNPPSWKEQAIWWSEQSEHNGNLALGYRRIKEEYIRAAAQPFWCFPPARSIPARAMLLPPPDLDLKMPLPPPDSNLKLNRATGSGRDVSEKGTSPFNIDN